MEEELISVVVPIYRVEKYLRTCVESILCQTYKNIEVILVDDGSTDNCPRICDSFAEADRRIKVIHKRNGGLSDARNIGITQSKGKYISVIDADDFVENTYLQTLLNLLKKTGSDIAVCNYQMFSDNGLQINYLCKSEKIEVFDDKQQIMRNFFNNKCGITVVAWNKLYKRYLFNEIEYPKGKNYEDEATTYRLFYKAKKVVYTNTPLYYYLQRQDSIMGEKMGMKNLVAFEALDGAIQFYEENNENYLRNLAVLRFFKTLKLYRIKAADQLKRNPDNKELKNAKESLDRLYRSKKIEYKYSENVTMQLYGLLKQITYRG